MQVEKNIQQHIETKLSKQIKSSGVTCQDYWIQILARDLHDTLDVLRKDEFCCFDGFVDLCGVDYHPQKPRFESVIHLYSHKKRHRIRIRVLVPDESLTVPSIVSYWSAANWQEREAFDMYGIRYQNHPNLKRILSPPNIAVYPQRKDFPLKGDQTKGQKQ